MMSNKVRPTPATVICPFVKYCSSSASGTYIHEQLRTLPLVIQIVSNLFMNGSSKFYVAILIRKNEMNLEIPTLDQFNIKGNQKNSERYV